MIEIQVLVPKFDRKYRNKLKSAASKALELAGNKKKCTLTLSIGSDEFVRELNKTYRQVDQPTDVLSFTEEYTVPGSSVLYLGDIAVSYPTAKAQAEIAGHSVLNELVLLTIHGVLHLLGYDHQDQNERAEMWKLQYQILESLGINMSRFSGDSDFE